MFDPEDENPPEKIYLLECGHFGIREFKNGEEFCTQCFDEYDTQCQEALKEYDDDNSNV